MHESTKSASASLDLHRLVVWVVTLATARLECHKFAKIGRMFICICCRIERYPLARLCIIMNSSLADLTEFVGMAAPSMTSTPVREEQEEIFLPDDVNPGVSVTNGQHALMNWCFQTIFMHFEDY